MAKQTKPFIVEIKHSRKLKTGSQKPPIWGSLDLKLESATDPATGNFAASADVAESHQNVRMHEPQG